MNGNGVPIIGGPKPRIGVQFHALVRRLDETGTMEASGVVQGPNGPVPLTERGDYMDATELLEAIRHIVREELAHAQEVT